ncbi:8-amino-7-oxononanoate synthase [Nakamurella sp.]|uniref:8-amino-7-oxononanoate synthase n=1 Tax=Nakamurella sp. TaxID=1869182 RepID=UPI00378428BC
MVSTIETLALDWLADAAAERIRAGLDRRLTPRPPASGLLDLASNDYLGLSTDPRVRAAAVDAVRVWGTGATGSRLVTGSTELHHELERGLAGLVGAPRAVVFSSGYLANIGMITALAGPDCLVICDRANHASLIDGCRLARSRLRVIPHADLARAETMLSTRAEERALLVIDAIGSADGDLLPLADWHRLARRHRALLLVDDAHGLGIRGGGRGAVAEAGIAHEPDVVTSVTLSKALAAQGGAVLGAPVVIDHLIATARPFIFDTGLNPAAAGAALAAVDIVVAQPQLAGRVLANAAELAEACRVPATGSAVIPVVVGAADRASGLAAAIRDRGIHVGCFRPPSVPAGSARLRITARANLTDTEIDRLRAAMDELAPRWI